MRHNFSKKESVMDKNELLLTKAHVKYWVSEGDKVGQTHTGQMKRGR